MKAALIVLVLHWGGFTGGTPALMAPHVHRLSAPGVEIVNPDYPLGDPEAAQRSVLRLAKRLHRHHAVIAYGTSAGATLALRLRQEGAVDGAVAIAPLIDVAGFNTVAPWSAQASVASSPGDHPCGRTRTNTLIVHGTDDDVAPFAASRGFAEHCGIRFAAIVGGTHKIIGHPRHCAMRFVRRMKRMFAASR